MSLLNKKYKEIQPTREYLLDKVVLAQAWKKSHNYIRSTNWYADTFELDRSAVDIDEKLDQWTAELVTSNFVFLPLKLVPAPKSDSWIFTRFKPVNAMDISNAEIHYEQFIGLTHLWHPRSNEKPKALRPLAHISIRDQTIISALMMCMANKVESLQGDPSKNYDEVHSSKIVNYGNRLYCRFENEKASFSWGSGTTYSKYFGDYQRFLNRPNHFGRIALQQRATNEIVYEVHLDLEKFYDKVDRKILARKVFDLFPGEDEMLNRILACFESWAWDEQSKEEFKSVCSDNGENIPIGIPQGLVAGGFLANVYLQEFDKELAALIGKNLTEEVHLVDYCRYVDDMRLIVVTKESQSNLKDKILTCINKKLENLCLSTNNDKTRVEKFINKTSGVSGKLRDIQGKVSGPLSINEIDEQLGHLESLIVLADNLRIESVDENNNPLATIESPNHDVREDTLLRFSANKIHTLLKQKRSLVAQEVDSSGIPIAGSWDYLQERMARKFIASWSKDPSLVLMLKKGLELFPDKRLFDPILGQLENVLLRKEKPKEVKISEYCLGEIFRHAATVIHSKSKWAFPAHADVESFFEKLQKKATEILEEGGAYSWRLSEQARLFCLIRNDSPLDNETACSSFNVITKMMKGYRNISVEMTKSDFVTNALLAYQIAIDNKNVIRSVSSLLEKTVQNGGQKRKLHALSDQDGEYFCKFIAAESPDFFFNLVAYGLSNEYRWPKKHHNLIMKTGFYQPKIKGGLDHVNTTVSLLGVIKHRDNPFRHENGVLALLIYLIEEGSFDFNSRIDFINTTISCKNWNAIQELRETVVTCDPKTDSDPLFKIPHWVNAEHAPLYHIGIFLRSCLLGTIDWSSAHAPMQKMGMYSGLRSSFYKRNLGMMHSPEAIGGEAAPMSNWLSSLLFHLLQWPGIEIHRNRQNWNAIKDIPSLVRTIKEHLKQQRDLYCALSKTPIYVERISLDWPKEKSDLKVVMVQSLLPKKADFAEHGLMLNTPKYRARHRRHVAAVAELLLHKNYGHSSIDDENYNKKANIDLIVWPELAVNNDDIDILKRLSDKTGAMIFTGLTFCHLLNTEGPNNVAKWIIPSKVQGARQFISRMQGKQHMMKDEIGKIKPWRPYQLFVELIHPAFEDQQGFRLTGSICYDATDIKMSADLQSKSDAYLIPTLNVDVNTFDAMVDALYYHMYQHVVLVNTGEFGGSVAKAPYKERHERLITHVHGSNQVSISSFDMNMFDFRSIGKSYKSGKKVKTKPAGLK